jgi:hypothetical protein
MLILYLEVSSKKILIISVLLILCCLCVHSAFQVMLDEMAIPMYVIVSTDSRMCPSKM